MGLTPQAAHAQLAYTDSAIQVAVKVEEGVKQLTKAEKSQKNSRLVLCIMFLLCVMVLMVFILFFRRVVPLIAG